ncbi:MAG: 16S rRNA (cytosine(967)-C(5))-methyltransferase RsmB [Gammaproteobacteria bacterium]
MNLRSTAAHIIYEVVIHGRSLADVLSEESSEFKDPRDRALLQAICYGVCRWYFRLDAILKQLLEKPLKERDLDIHMLLMVGLYQLIDMRIPDYAAVTETVAATKDFKKPWAKALVNGVLRQYQRHADELNEHTAHQAIYAHPRWIIERLAKAYPDKWQQILESNNEHPPFALRVNQQHQSREKYLERLATTHIKAKSIPETLSGIIFEEAIDVQKVPGFAEGDISVQDGAAQLAAALLELAPGMKILDACAAPGGKTAHMLELQPAIECVAIDQDKSRLTSVTENLQRLGLTAQCIAADAADVSKWWDGKPFERILLDAPCSASGVIRRHPDIKVLRRESDLKKLIETQTRLLNALWPLLKKDGILLYATCSVFPEENTQVLEAFLASHPDAREEKITSSWGLDCVVGKQILPGMHDMDGFYFARLRK